MVKIVATIPLCLLSHNILAAPATNALPPELSSFTPDMDAVQVPPIPEASILIFVAVIGFAMMFRRRVR